MKFEIIQYNNFVYRIMKKIMFYITGIVNEH